MKFIGITGGVGAGKSAILQYLSEKENIRVMLADEIAHDLMKQGTRCYKKIIRAFMYDNILDSSGEFDRGKLAKVIFSSDEKRLKMNSIVHPAVKEYVKEQLALEKTKGKLDVLVLEAALLIEDHYDEVCDELWYIYASEEVRKERLMRTRGYSEEKVQQIFESQLPEEVYRKKCKVTIDNNGDLSETFLQIDKALASLEEETKENVIGMEQPFVFGLDIGTRNVVGTVGYQEECFYHTFADQNGTASIYQPKLGVGLEMSFDAKELDAFVEWKMMGVRDYVLGLECGNCYPNGRKDMRESGMLKFLQPGEKKEYRVKIKIIEK